ncbi:MAG: hypothetical protein HFI92_07855 [Lachnospiraceae bacterium]|nr:hypothetical protein [Lachnospiraceae bacterium]
MNIYLGNCWFNRPYDDQTDIIKSKAEEIMKTGIKIIKIMNRGIHCLLEKLGVAETERFTAVINREQFDYTKWQRERFDNGREKERSTHDVICRIPQVHHL